MASGGWMAARIRMRPPQPGHRRISIAKTRRRRSAQPSRRGGASSWRTAQPRARWTLAWVGWARLPARGRTSFRRGPLCGKRLAMGSPCSRPACAQPSERAGPARASPARARCGPARSRTARGCRGNARDGSAAAAPGRRASPRARAARRRRGSCRRASGASGGREVSHPPIARAARSPRAGARRSAQRRSRRFRSRAGTATLACRLTPSTLAQRSPCNSGRASGSMRSPTRSMRRPARLPVATRPATDAA